VKPVGGKTSEYPFIQNDNMNNTFLYLFLAGGCITTLLSCGGQPKAESNQHEPEQQSVTAIQETRDYCFRQLTGKDTFRVQLHIEGSKVTGNMDNIPDQKDARRGNITGIISGDEIKAVWHFQQEGMNDSIPVAFKLTEEALMQRPSIVNPSSGREEPDTKAGYTISIPKVACN
jgi:hypothetical protein